MIEIRRMTEWLSVEAGNADAHSDPDPAVLRAFYAEVEHLAGIGCWYFDLTDQILWWSDELYRLHELEPGIPLSDQTYVESCIHVEDRAFVAELFAALAADTLAELQGKIRVVSRADHIRHVWFRAQRRSDVAGPGGCYVGIVQEWAEEKEADLSTIERSQVRETGQLDAVPRRSEPMLALLIEAAPQPVIVTDDRDCITLVNAQTHTAFGFTPQELIGQSIDLILEAGTLADGVRADRGDVQPSRRQALHGRHKNGLAFPLEVHASRIETAGGPLTINFVVDVSKYHHAEQELRNALQQERELSEMKSRFVSIVSHEFRTPLAVIQATSETLRDFINQMDEDQWTRKFNKISGQVSHMTDMLEDILVFGKMASATIEIRREWLSLCDLLEDAVAVAQQRYAKHTFITTSNTDCEDQVASVYLDRKLINQTLNNLLSNAAKYSAAGTRIWLDVHYADDLVTLTVRDEGIGIPGEDQAHLFEPFHRGANTSGRQGTGLGLSIARQAVELHGGTMTFESAVGIGTAFVVRLPTGRGQPNAQKVAVRSFRKGAN